MAESFARCEAVSGWRACIDCGSFVLGRERERGDARCTDVDAIVVRQGILRVGDARCSEPLASRVWDARHREIKRFLVCTAFEDEALLRKG